MKIVRQRLPMLCLCLPLSALSGHFFLILMVPIDRY
jgi:hypothetical protein